MPAGRPRKPLAIHEAHGTFRADRHGDSVLQFRAEGYVTKPDGMTQAASDLWDSLAGDMKRVAARIDASALVGMCEWYAVYQENAAALRDIKPADPLYGYVLKQRAIAWTHFAAMAGKFGLTPSDRARLQIKPEEKPQGIRTRGRSA